ncbi:DUF805 domain-containing protein [Phenylobacterium sp.]|jgi:uncharacterized membrane protein YhaH (DUF805 family)|uniref:DUF805 domain-containing protein n=1 Tax=Phenylobacterium sp. TaxID=1871053 RepID=UPI002E2FE72A|nr:DUF805 domain-containing protein [Phenylobacterium sp.]HEX4709381.1 DUF805 domain-containing protein [Phenylobacterium sp.]
MGGVLKYLSFQGRANRKRFWLTGLSIVGLLFVTALFTGLLALVPGLSLIIIPLWLAFFVASIANAARRLHDRGKSAWWLLLFYLLPMVLSLPADLAKFGPADDFQLAASALAVLGLPFSLWGLVVMGFLKGTTGPNKYGDDPLAPPLQEVFA